MASCFAESLMEKRGRERERERGRVSFLVGFGSELQVLHFIVLLMRRNVEIVC